MEIIRDQIFVNPEEIRSMSVDQGFITVHLEDGTSFCSRSCEYVEDAETWRELTLTSREIKNWLLFN